MVTANKSNKCLHDIIYPNSKFTLLTIPAKKWLEAYNYDFTPYLETLKHNGARYVSWSYAKKFLIEFFDGKLAVAYEKDPKTQNWYFVDGGSPDKHPYIKAFIYDVTSFARTDASYFPIMLHGNKPCTLTPDNMTLNKNLQRAGVKTIADGTGFGLRAWTGEDFDSDKIGLLIKLRERNDQYRSLTGDGHSAYNGVHMGLSVEELTKIGMRIRSDLDNFQKVEKNETTGGKQDAGN